MVSIVGASVSKGFTLKAVAAFTVPNGDYKAAYKKLSGREPDDAEVERRTTTVGLAPLLRNACPEEKVTIKDYSNAMLFMNPVATGRFMLRSGFAAKPDLVIGLDFMFWFGYGAGPLLSEGGSETERALDRAFHRLREQDEAFAMLDGMLEDFEGALVLGGLPRPERRGALDDHEEHDPRGSYPARTQSPAEGLGEEAPPGEDLVPRWAGALDSEAGADPRGGRRETVHDGGGRLPARPGPCHATGHGLPDGGPDAVPRKAGARQSADPRGRIRPKFAHRRGGGAGGVRPAAREEIGSSV